MPEIRYLARLSETPSVPTWIYSLAPVEVKQAMLLETARRLGLAGTLRQGAVEKHQGAITYVEGPWAVTLYRASGGLRFHDRSRWMVDDGRSEVTFGDETAVELAKEVIEKYDLAPLDQLRTYRITRLHAAAYEVKTLKGGVRVIDIGVIFQRMIEGVPVDGPGGKIMVYLDARGEMTGFDRLWREIQGAGRPVQALRDPRFAEEELVRYQTDQLRRIEVTEVRFGYFELGWRSPQRFLQPAYVMMLRRVGVDERFTKGAVHVTPAADPPAGPLMRARRARPPDAPAR
jgi:hypothetical protein